MTLSEQRQNPFRSEEDDEVISPISPTSRELERSDHPMVHYPSWSEMSEFDFAGDGRARPSPRERLKPENGDDNAHSLRNRESHVGRYELA